MRATVARRTGGRALRASAALGLVCAVLLAGCSADEPKPPAATASTAGAGSEPSPSASAGAGDPADAAQYFIDPADVSVLATATAPSRSKKGATVTAEVLAVQAYEDSTTLVFQLKSSEDGDTNGSLGYDTVSIAVPSANLRLLPNQFTPSAKAKSQKPECLCPYYASPLTTTPIRISAMYPPLPADATQVDVVVPGFTPMKVPVTRG